MGDVIHDYKCVAIIRESNLPKFGIVRNPWAWYVSWYNFALHGSDMMQRVIKGPTFKYLPKPDFETMLRYYIQPTKDFKYKIYIDSLAHHKDSDWLYSWYIYTSTWLEKDISLYEHLYDLYTYDCRYLCKTESIREDIINILNNIGYLTPEIHRRINNTNNINIGNKQVDYRTYYTDETRHLVESTHQRIINKHGYTFE